MFNVNDYVVYKRDVCKVMEIKKNNLNNEDYYLLVPIDDQSLKIEIPVTNRSGFLRKLITKEEVEKFISIIPSIGIIESNDKQIENEYKRLKASNNHEDLIKIIKTTYFRNKERLDNNKKIGDRDEIYFNKAERYLYNEFRIVLGLSYEDTKKYVVDKALNLSE